MRGMCNNPMQKPHGRVGQADVFQSLERGSTPENYRSHHSRHGGFNHEQAMAVEHR